MDNIFIKLIENNKIKNIEDLKKVYRNIAKKTHPDAVGSDQFVKTFILLKKYYEEAKIFLESKNNITEKKSETNNENYRFLFFQELKILDTLELPYNFNNEKIKSKINESNELLKSFFIKWKKDYYELYLSANLEYSRIKKERPKNNLANLRKPLIYMNLKPVFFNLCNYHITGLEFYQKQIKRNLNMIIKRLDENHYFALKKYLLLLIDDMKNGPAIFG